MKKQCSFILLLVLVIIATACSNDTEVHKADKKDGQGRIKVIMYGDFKCPYCKKVETKVMPNLKKEYIDTNKIDYQFVNMAFLGDDSIIGSRAGHAIQHYAPKQFLEFQRLMFEQQPDSEKAWINKKLVDKQIDKLSISSSVKAQIKADYKKKDSKSWKAAQKDQQQYKDNHVKTAPTVYIHGDKLEDPYDFKQYKKKIDKHL
ncbi:DsbA family protein [Staphylococcus caeli]|uniref:Protein-disulfide isomerase n=1 Tax=Staphylococcus caeli TaxID=2201815 RepID=A0A1D4L8W1_9STAP|nr:DsbA family protein [Staphylococcus caeli]SCS82432.1 protein-disulfide isomerase [Staphylococcus caeli]SCS91822.1 protein-disulfide isomerase [Staphylococcus caeli]